MDMDQRSKNSISGGKKGRIILLGDGSEILTGSEDTDMIDTEEEDEDLASQVRKEKADHDNAAKSGMHTDVYTGGIHSANHELGKNENSD